MNKQSNKTHTPVADFAAISNTSFDEEAVNVCKMINSQQEQEQNK